MADKINEIVGKEAFDQIAKLSKELDGLAGKIEKLSKLESVNTEDNARLSNKVKGTKDLNTVTDKYINVSKQLASSREQVRLSYVEENKEIQKNKLLAAEKNKLAKAEAILNDKTAGTRQRLVALNQKLIIEQNRLNLSEEKGIKRNKEINKQLEENKKVLIETADAYEKQRSGISRYAQAIQSSFTKILTTAGLIITAFKSFSAVIKTTVEINKNIRDTSSAFGLNSDEAKGLTSEIRGLAKAYEKDFNTVLKSANILSKEFGISGTFAIDLIKKGFRSGADSTGEFLDILKEYPAQLKQVGLSAEQSINLISQTQNAGVFSDKGIDAIKEAGIRLRELTPATRAALDGIGLSSVEIEKQLRNGTKSIFDIIKLVSSQLSTLPEQSKEVGTALADIFGGAGEDAGLRFLKTLKDINLNISKTAEPARNLADASAELREEWSNTVDSFVGGSGVISKALTGIIDFINEVVVSLRRLNLGEEELALELTFDEAKKNVEDFNRELERSNKDIIASNEILIDQYNEYLKILPKNSDDYNKLQKAVSDLSDANNKLRLSDNITTEERIRAYESQITALNNNIIEQKKLLDKEGENISQSDKKKIAGIIGRQTNEINLYNEYIAQLKLKGTEIKNELEQIVKTAIEPEKLSEIKISVADIDVDNVKIGDSLDEIYKLTLDKDSDFIEERARLFEEAGNRLTQIEQETIDARRGLIEQGLSNLEEYSGRISENQLNAIDEIRQRENEAFENQKEIYKNNAEIVDELNKRQSENNKKRDEEERQVQRNAAKRSIAIASFGKLIKLIQLKIDSTLAATAALLPPPIGLGPVAGAPVAAAIKTKALIDAIAIAATPLPSIPKFFKGTNYSPEGYAWVGERGVEQIMYPGGQMALTPSTATIQYLPKGSKVIPHERTKEIVNNFDDSRIVSALGRKNELNITEKGIVKVVRNGNAITLRRKQLLRG